MNGGNRWVHRASLLVLALGSVACGGCAANEKRVSAEQQTKLEHGAIARVGNETIDGVAVSRIAAQQGVSPEEARSRAIFDAIMATGARERGMSKHLDVIVACRGILARAVLADLKKQASTQPMTDEELERFTRLHWLDMDRPETRRAVHVVVETRETDDAQKRKSQVDLAKAIALAVKGITDPDVFLAKARAVPAEGLVVTAERLPPVTVDGRVADLDNRPAPGTAGQTFAKDFVAALFGLQRVGDQSAVVPTELGWHVILFLGVQPGVTVPTETRVGLLWDEVVAARAKELTDTLVDQLRRTMEARVERNAENTLGLLPVPSQER